MSFVKHSALLVPIAVIANSVIDIERASLAAHQEIEVDTHENLRLLLEQEHAADAEPTLDREKR